MLRFCADTKESHKEWPPLVAGRSQNSHCFQHVNSDALLQPPNISAGDKCLSDRLYLWNWIRGRGFFLFCFGLCVFFVSFALEEGEDSYKSCVLLADKCLGHLKNNSRMQPQTNSFMTAAGLLSSPFFAPFPPPKVSVAWILLNEAEVL